MFCFVISYLQKRVLFNQMKNLRTEDEALKAQLANAQQVIQSLRQENIDFKAMNAESFIVRERMQRAEVDNDRLRAEMRASEDLLQSSKDTVKLLRGKLAGKVRYAFDAGRCFGLTRCLYYFLHI